MSTKILDELADELRIEGWRPDTRSAVEIIEYDIAENEQATRAQNLFDKLIQEKRKKEATKVAWFCWYRFGIDLGLFN